MSIEVEVTEVQPQTAAVFDIKTPYEKLGENMGTGYEKLFGHLGKNGVQPVGPAFAVYRDVEQPEWSVTLGAPVASTVPEGDGIKMGKLPGGKVAVAWHLGSYDGLSEAWEAFTEWMKEQDYEPAEMAWESYVVDSATEPDSSKWKTKLVWPIQ